jgi:hypothetical protein
MKMMAPTKL